ncbi:hypothetical protein HEP86_25225 [Streptomyces sp. RPA4-5]|uniref:hypothetical protein n=1 Tax=unclassified Streptomyces TaxID=2593676 RepID=UPI00143EDAEC|nr:MULTISPECIES: hypothetical protein [unclassified Streptomyces]QIY57223.1 hypothetical protein HEP86_25225 [Streptomyces sp. RPA4-5]WJY40263.1 hypothetical protein QT196_24950 [Streptomyces sp. P9-2B-2]
MADKDVEQTDERGYGPGPWWADLGTWGAVAAIVLGSLVAVWVFFRLPGTPEEPASGYYGAAKVIAIGLVVVGSTLLGRRRTRAAAIAETNERERA